MMKRRTVVAILLLVAQSASAATSLSQWGVTWTFDKDYPVGQFANGDWEVEAPDGLTIVGIDPPSRLVDGRIKNGAMLNPLPSQKSQGYDNKMPNSPYDPSLNVAFDVSPAKPLVLTPGSSLISSISMEAAGSTPQLRRAAILTVLAALPAPGSFRPAYCGSDKTIKFNTSMLNYSLLKRLPPVANAPTPAVAAKTFAAPWIEHKPGWSGSWMHPKENMPEYGREIHAAIGMGALVLHLDYEPAQKEGLLVPYVQLGIDYYGIVAAGGKWNWLNDGGTAGGRKWPILFAGLMLNDDAMKAIGQKSGDYLYSEGYGPGNPPPDYVHFGEDDSTHYVTKADVDITNSPTWKPDTRAAEKTPYTVADIGMPEWGIKHSTAPQANNRALSANYRAVAGPPFHGTALAALLTEGGKELWNHDAYFDYTDRYMAFTATGGEYSGWWSYFGTFTRNMWDAYRSACGPVWPSTEWPSDPKMLPIADQRVTAGTELKLMIGMPNSELRVTATGLPTGSELVGGIFSWTPSVQAVGTYVVQFTQTNGVMSSSVPVTIVVDKPKSTIVLGEPSIELLDGRLRIEIPIKVD